MIDKSIVIIFINVLLRQYIRCEGRDTAIFAVVFLRQSDRCEGKSTAILFTVPL